MQKGALLLLTSLTLMLSFATPRMGGSEAIAMAGDWSSFQEPRTVVQTRCPPRTQYSAEEIRRMGTELEKLGSSSQTARFVRDYQTLRRRCDAYEAK